MYCFMQALPFSDALKLFGYLKDWTHNPDTVSHLAGTYLKKLPCRVSCKLSAAMGEK